MFYFADNKNQQKKIRFAYFVRKSRNNNLLKNEFKMDIEIIISQNVQLMKFSFLKIFLFLLLQMDLPEQMKNTINL